MNLRALVFLVVVAIAQATQEQAGKCSNPTKCPPIMSSPQCGSDGTTYPNLCSAQKQQAMLTCQRKKFSFTPGKCKKKLFAADAQVDDESIIVAVPHLRYQRSNF